ncbi:unnamed protein product [Paramecium pentaurelia]|uniref:Vacuolar ATP synthase subunit E n=1 Tax=Paramecium pentaurelia TaxID=43138 RepID=A0A8S1VKE4_9CILI|nr:unnamed protein product [Paramecium pentaurelia]
MADFNPQERVKKMVNAIKAEATEKAEQIKDMAAQQFRIEKNKLLNQQKERIIEEYKKKIESYTIEKRIQRSSRINQSRLSKMQARFELIQRLKEEVRQKMAKLIQDQSVYRELLKNLIVQGMIKLLEPRIELTCLEQDVSLVRSILGECQEEFQQIIKKETIKDFKTTLSINQSQYLTEKMGKPILGGVVLSCANSRIVCSNTLDDRLELSLQEFLPDIRNGLFRK